MLARDELEDCNNEREMWITQGGIRMLRKIIEWDNDLKDQIQQKVMLEESSGGEDNG